ncbi:unnamed protein product [Adineta steineri]|uniref:Uncharacterized protein n=1 Tax=Adineta steineri TaxID=433720 RepID=A0A814G3D5_9BILA|nr:unnamed protein product [Adineta steineri]
MNETTEDDNKIELLPPPPLPPIINVIEDSIASRTKEITKRPKRERSPPIQILPPAPKIKKVKEVAPKLPDKTKWTLEEQKQFFGALRIYGKNFEALGQFFNTRRRLVNPEAQKRTFGQIRCFYYRSFRTVSKLCTFTEEEKSNVDSFELRSVLAYLCLKPKVKYFDKKPTITVLHQLIRNGNAFIRVKGQREHVSIIGKALKPPKTSTTLGSTKQTDRTLSKHVKILLSPASSNAYMRVALSCRYPHVEVLLSRSTTIYELIDKLTQYWQLNNHAHCVNQLFKDDSSSEQFILYPHGSYLISIDSPLLPNDIIDLSARKQARSRSDSEHSTEPYIDSSLNIIRKKANLSENDESTGGIHNSSISPVTNSNKSNLARTAILSAAKRAACNNMNNCDGTAFTLIDGTEDEADSSAGLFKQRFDTIDLTDEFASEDEIEPDANVPAPVIIVMEQLLHLLMFASEDEIEPDANVPAPVSQTVTMPTVNNPTITLADLTQGMTRINSLFSTLTIGELQKLLQRPKELRLIYDFNNLSRTNTNELSSTYLHYVIQIANQCLTSIAERQLQTEMKTAKKTNTKKQQILRSKCYCTCCSHHHHQLNTKDQKRSSTKVNNSSNTDISALLQKAQSIPAEEFLNEDILTVQTSSNNINNNANLISDGDLHNKQTPLSQLDEQSDIFNSLSWPTETVTTSLEQSQLPALSQPPISTLFNSTTTSTTPELSPLLTLLLPMMNGVEPTPPPSTQPKPSAIVFSSNNGVIDDPLIQSLAAEQAASANNYDLLLYRHKRVRRPLRYGDQSTQDEADSSAGLFKQRFDTIDLTDEFASEDEIEPDANVPAPVSQTVTMPTVNNPTITLADLTQGMTRINSLFSTLTIGELQKLLQRPKELRLIYDFNNLSRTNTNESSSTYLHYVIQIANQCLTSIAERQLQTEMKTAKKTNTKKQQILRSKCYCTCCSHHHHQLNTKDQKRSSTKFNNSSNTDICALLQKAQSIPAEEFLNEDILTVQTSSNNINNNANLISDGDLHNKQTPLSQLDEQSDIFNSLTWPTETVTTSLEQSQLPALSQPPISTLSNSTTTTSPELSPLLTLLLPMMNGVEPTPPPPPQPKSSAIVFSSNNGVIDDPLIQSLAAEQAASANNYDLLLYRHKRVHIFLFPCL